MTERYLVATTKRDRNGQYVPRILLVSRGGKDWPEVKEDITPRDIASEQYGVEAGALHTAKVRAKELARGRVVRPGIQDPDWQDVVTL